MILVIKRFKTSKNHINVIIFVSHLVGTSAPFSSSAVVAVLFPLILFEMATTSKKETDDDLISLELPVSISRR